MPAPKRVPDEKVRSAISEWGGNITATADALGMTGTNLRKRLFSLAVDVESMRRAKGSGLPSPPITPIAQAGPHAHKSAAALFPASGKAPTLGGMQAALKEEPEPPIRSVPVRQKPLRLRPAHQDRLREAKYDFQARFRVETDENAVLQQFFDERFEEWLGDKLAAVDREPKETKR